MAEVLGKREEDQWKKRDRIVRKIKFIPKSLLPNEKAARKRNQKEPKTDMHKEEGQIESKNAPIEIKKGFREKGHPLRELTSV